MGDQVWQVEISESCSLWSLVTNEVQQGSLMGPVLLTTSINDLKQTAECSLIRCEVTPSQQDHLMMLLRAGLPPEGTEDGLEEEANGNVTKFNTDKCKVLPQEERVP